MQRFAFLSAPPPPYATDLKDLDVPPSYDTAAAQAAIDKLTPEEREKFEAGIAAATSAADLQPALKNSAELAAQACQNIESMFVSLTATLTAVDAKYTPPGKQGFAPQLAVIQQVFAPDCSWTVRSWEADGLYTELPQDGLGLAAARARHRALWRE